MAKYFFNGQEFEASIVMDRFEQVFEYIGSFILQENDDELMGIIYEDYDFYYTDLADFRLDILVDNNYITDEIREKAHKMRVLSEKMLNEKVKRSAYIIRNSPEWNQIFSLADEIKLFLFHKYN